MPDFGRWTAGGGDPSLNEINRADRFFEALAAKQPVYSTDSAEAELAFLFSEFRDDVRDAPVTAPVSAADAAEALRGGLSKNRGPRRGFAVVGSVAAAMLCIGGFGTAVYGSSPGDSLYGMRTTIFGQQEQTRDDQVSLASAQLQQVQQLIDQGQWQQAQDKLVEVSSAVQGVDEVESKQQLVQQWNALTYKVVEQNPAATLPPGEPLPVLPSSPLTWLPVPADATTSTSTSISATTTTSDSTASSSTSATSSSSATSDTSTTTVPSEVLQTPPPDSTAPSASTSTSAAAPTPSSSPTPTPTASTPPVTSTSPSPSSASSSSPTTTTTSTAVTPKPSAPVVEPPAPQPRLAPNPSVEPSQPAPSPSPAERPNPTPTTTTVVPSPGGVS